MGHVSLLSVHKSGPDCSSRCCTSLY